MWDVAVADNPDARERGSAMTGDGTDGVIVAWYDNREGSSTEVYAQRMNANGQEQWTSGGVLVSPVDEDQNETSFCSKIVGDGQGGAIVTFVDDRVLGLEQGLYAQKLGPDGRLGWSRFVAWSSNPPACTQDEYDVCSDGAGGIYLVFEFADITAQQNSIRGMHLSGAGDRLWANAEFELAGNFKTSIGHLIHASQHSLNNARAIPDGAGGLIALWQDNPGLFDPNTPQHTRGQKLNGAGDLLWGEEEMKEAGLMLNSIDETSPPVKALVDEGGNLYFTFHDGDAYRLQKINPIGVVQWDNGIIFRSITAGSVPPLVVTSCGDVIVSYWDRSTTDVIARRYNPMGETVWMNDELRVSAVEGDQLVPLIAIDDEDNLVAVWRDDRILGPSSSELDIYMQGFNKAGELGGPVSAINDKEPVICQTTVYPNPVRANITITIPHQPVKDGIVTVFNTLGRRVWQQTVTTAAREFFLAADGWPAGLYMLEINYGDSRRYAGLFVVE